MLHPSHPPARPILASLLLLAGCGLDPEFTYQVHVADAILAPPGAIAGAPAVLPGRVLTGQVWLRSTALVAAAVRIEDAQDRHRLLSPADLTTDAAGRFTWAVAGISALPRLLVVRVTQGPIELFGLALVGQKDLPPVTVTLGSTVITKTVVPVLASLLPYADQQAALTDRLRQAISLIPAVDAEVARPNDDRLKVFVPEARELPDPVLLNDLTNAYVAYAEGGKALVGILDAASWWLFDRLQGGGPLLQGASWQFGHRTVLAPQLTRQDGGILVLSHRDRRIVLNVANGTPSSLEEAVRASNSALHNRPWEAVSVSGSDSASAPDKAPERTQAGGGVGPGPGDGTIVSGTARP